MDSAEGTTESAEAPATETAGLEVPADETAPPATGEQTEDEGFAPLDIGSLPEDQQEIAKTIERQFKSAMTRARQSDSEKLREAQEAMELAERLNDPEKALDALNELAAKHGFSQESADEPVEVPGEEPDETSKRLQELSEAEERRAAKEAESERENRISLIAEHIEDGLEGYASELGVDQVPEDNEELITFAAIANPGSDRLPNVERAVELVQAVEAAAVQRFISKKAGQTPGPDTSGEGSGISQEDMSNDKARRSAAEKVAARHFADA
jgi:hypothetical protein